MKHYRPIRNRESYHGGTETRRRDGVNLRWFLGKNHAQISAIVLLERERSKAECEANLLSLSKYKRERTDQGLPRA